jgi:PHP family Zn ribbon phosphoesterase
VSRFGSEFNVLLDADIKEIADTSSAAIASIISIIRSKRLRIVPGYDGIYGKINFNKPEKKNKGVLKKGLWRFM